MISNDERSPSHLIPQKIREKYTDFVLSQTTSYCKTYRARSNLDGLTYSVRVLDTQSEFVKNHPDKAATLFLQEATYLCTRLGHLDAIKVEDLTISEGQIGFVTLQHLSIEHSMPQGQEYKIDQLIEDLKDDLSFLRNTMRFKLPDVDREAVYQVGNRFFLGDWAKLSLNVNDCPDEILLEGLVEKERKLRQVSINQTNLTDATKPLKVAWCSLFTNYISIYDFATQRISQRKGAEITEGVHTLVQQVPNQPYLISSNNCYYMYEASFQVFDVSKNNTEILRRDLVDNSSVWDIASNQKTSRVALFSIAGETAYHLLDGNSLKESSITKAKWHECQTEWISSLSFNTDGDQICLIDAHGVLLIVDVNDNKPQYEMKIGKTKAGTTWIDWNPEGSLLASCSRDGKVNMFDPREGKIVKSYDNLHKGFIDSVRWSPCGKMLATASSDCTVKILDLGTQTIIHQWHTADRRTDFI